MSIVRDFWNNVIGTADDAVDSAKQTVDTVTDNSAAVVNTVTDNATATVNTVTNNATATVNTVTNNAAATVNTVTDNVAATINTGTDIAAATINSLTDNAEVRSLTANAATAVKTTTDDAATAVKTTTDDAATAVKTTTDDAATVVKTTTDDAATTVKTTADDAATTVKTATDDASAEVTAAKNLVSGAIDTVTDTATGVAKTVTDTVSSEVQTVTDDASAAVATAKDLTSGAIDTVTDTAAGVAKTVTDTVSEEAQAAKDTISSAINVVEKEASAAVDTGKGVVSATVDAVEGAFSSASKGGQFTFAEVTLTKFQVGQFVQGSITIEGAVEFKPTVAPTGPGPSDKEVQAAVKPIIDDLWSQVKKNFKWVGDVTVKGDKKSIGISATLITTSTTYGPVTFEFKGFDFGVGSTGPKATVAGVGVDVPVIKQRINDVDYTIAVNASSGLGFGLSPAGLAEFGIDVGVEVLADIAVACIPLAAAAAIFAAGYFEIEEGEDIGEISLEATKALQAYAQSYANVMAGGSPAGGNGSAEGAAKAKADLAKLKAQYNDEELVVQKAKEAGIYSKVVAAAKPQFRAAAEAAFKKKHELRVEVFGMPPSFDDILDARLAHVGDASDEKSVDTRDKDGNI
jgi:hypothetical protein